MDLQEKVNLQKQKRVIPNGEPRIITENYMTSRIKTTSGLMVIKRNKNYEFCKMIRQTLFETTKMKNINLD